MKAFWLSWCYLVDSEEIQANPNKSIQQNCGPLQT